MTNSRTTTPSPTSTISSSPSPSLDDQGDLPTPSSRAPHSGRRHRGGSDSSGPSLPFSQTIAVHADTGSGSANKGPNHSSTIDGAGSRRQSKSQTQSQEEDKATPGYAWKNKQAVEERERLQSGLVDSEWSDGEFGDIFTAAVPYDTVPDQVMDEGIDEVMDEGV